MPTVPDRRTRKRLATRQAISDAATRLFFEKGFEQVTIDEIAEAADVGRMTVYKHFLRKEDMFFDLDELMHEDLMAAIRQRDPDVTLIETLRLLAHHVIAEQKPYIEFNEGSQHFTDTIRSSETLKARVRAFRDEFTQVVAIALADSVGKSPDDADAHLIASLLVATWFVAFIEAHRTYQRLQNVGEAEAVFLTLVDRGTVGINAMIAGTPYA